jgi:hypothetical protein
MENSALAMSIILLSAKAVACSCADKDIKQIIDTSQHIFIAEIASVRKNPDSKGPLDTTLASFSVVERIKGTPGELGQLNSGYGGGDCGIPFLVGHKMLIFTTDGTVSMCGRQQILPWISG